MLPLNGSFPVRFIRDVFVENYDPTIEGQWLIVTVALSFDQPYRAIS